jgi:putative cofactor-binding repeat protein
MDCHFEGARRLNLALTAATDVEVLRCRFIGRAEGVRRPAAGIDVEPNHGDALGMRSLAARITVTDCVFERHAGGGIIVSEAGRTRDVSVSGCTFRDNSGWVIQSGGHRLRFENNFVASHRCFRDWSDECSSQHTCVILLTAGADSVVSGNTIRNFEESDLPAIMLRSNSSSGGSPERARVESNVVACQSGRALQIAASFVTVDANTFIVPPDNSSYLIQATQYTTAAGETYETCGLVVTNNKIIAEESAARDGGFLSIEASSHAWLVAGNHVMPSYNHTLNLGSSATLGIFSNNTLPSSSGEAGAEVLTGNRYSLLTCEIRERVAPDESDSIQSVEMVFSDCCSDLAPPPPPPPPPPPSTDLELRIVEFRVPGRQHQYSYDTLELEFELDATWSGRTRSRRFTMSRTTNTDWPIESLNVALGSGTSGGALSLRVVELDRGRGHWTEANNADDVGSARRSIARPGRFELTVLVRAAPSFPSRDLSCVVVVEANHP